MLSKSSILASGLLLAAVCLSSCGHGESSLAPDKAVGEIGRKPEFFSTAYLFRSGDQNTLTAVDRKGHTLQQFSLEPFEHKRSLDRKSTRLNSSH